MCKCTGETIENAHELNTEFGEIKVQGEARRGKRHVKEEGSSGNIPDSKCDWTHVSAIIQEHTG